MSISVLLVDDHPISRKGLRLLLDGEEDIRVVGEAGDGKAAIEQVRELSPDVVIMDISMPKLNGIEATRQLLSSSPDTKVVALSIHAGKQFVKDMLSAGASGYILKESIPKELTGCIRKVMQNEVCLSDAITGVVVKGILQGGIEDVVPETSHRGLADESAAILRTKLNRPLMISNRWVARPRLISRLNEGMEKRVTLISAPAGYGKSTLAAQWLEQSRRRSAWLSLDENDNRPEGFLRYLVAALRSAVPGVCEEVERLLLAANLPAPEYVANVMVSELIDLDHSILLVVDDYHTIASEVVQTTIVRMLNHLPDTVHIAVLTRADPPWPIGLWRARHWISELRAADLRFSFEETQKLLLRTFKHSLTAEAVKIIQRRTEGWVTGLQLAQLSIMNAENPDQFARDFSQCDGFMVDFLMDEVISRQDTDIVDFLAISALFDGFCVPLCDFLMTDQKAAGESRRIISQIERENLFVVSLDKENSWYRYHHLFQRFLVQYLSQHVSPQRKKVIHERAGQWFADRGLIEEAIQHLITAGDMDGAATLVEGRLHSTLDENPDFTILDRWLSMFPKSEKQRLPSLMVAQAVYYAYVNNLSEALVLADKTEAILRDPGCAIPLPRRESLLGDIEAIYAFCLYWQGDSQTALQHAQRAVRLVPDEHHTVHGVAIMYTAFSLALLGRRDEAFTLLSDALSKDYAADRRMAGQLLTCQAIIHTYAGNLSAVRKSAQQVFTIHKTTPSYDFWRGAAHFFLGSIAYERNLLDEAENHFRHMEKFCYRMDPRIYHNGLLGLARTALAQKEATEAGEYAAAARKFALEIKDPSSLTFSDSFELRLGARSVEDSSHPKTHGLKGDYNQLWIEPLSLIRAEYRVNRATPEDCDTAPGDIEEALKQAEQHHNTRQVIQLLAIKTVVLKCRGNLEGALELLAETLKMTKPLQFVRTFLDRGPQMAELLEELLKKRPANQSSRILLDAFAGEKHSVALTAHPKQERYSDITSIEVNDAAPDSLLSNREIEILSMLEQRLSNKEIAERLFISPETVKRHTSNIYRKLNVKGRREAVTVAKGRCLPNEE